jgi:hypothetical protein
MEADGTLRAYCCSVMAQSQLQWRNMFTPPPLPRPPGSTSPAGQPAEKAGRQRPKSRRPPPSPKARIVAPFVSSGRALPPPRCVLEGRGLQAANDVVPGRVLDADALLAEAPLPPASGVRLADDYWTEPHQPPEAVTLPDDGAPPPMAAIDLADELLGELLPEASFDDELLDELSAIEDDGWISPPVDSVAALLVDAIAAYDEQPEVEIDYLDEIEADERPTARFHRDEVLPGLEHLEPAARCCSSGADVSGDERHDDSVDQSEEETGRYSARSDPWQEGLQLPDDGEGCVGRIYVIPERSDEETRRMERHG